MAWKLDDHSHELATLLDVDAVLLTLSDAGLADSGYKFRDEVSIVTLTCIRFNDRRLDYLQKYETLKSMAENCDVTNRSEPVFGELVELVKMTLNRM